MDGIPSVEEVRRKMFMPLSGWGSGYFREDGEEQTEMFQEKGSSDEEVEEDSCSQTKLPLDLSSTQTYSIEDFYDLDKNPLNRENPPPIPIPSKGNLYSINHLIKKHVAEDKKRFIRLFKCYEDDYLRSARNLFKSLEYDIEENIVDLELLCEFFVLLLKLCDKHLVCRLLDNLNYRLLFGALEYNPNGRGFLAEYRKEIDDPERYKHLSLLNLKEYMNQTKQVYRLIYLKKILLHFGVNDTLMTFLTKEAYCKSLELAREIISDSKTFSRIIDIKPIREDDYSQVYEDVLDSKTHEITKAKVMFFREITTVLKSLQEPGLRRQFFATAPNEEGIFMLLDDLLQAPLSHCKRLEKRRKDTLRGLNDFRSRQRRVLEACYKPHYRIPDNICELVKLSLEVFHGISSLEPNHMILHIYRTFSNYGRSKIFENLAFILLHAKDEYIKDQVYHFLAGCFCPMIEPANKHLIIEMLLDLVLFKVFVPYMDQPECMSCKNLEEYHYTCYIICKCVALIFSSKQPSQFVSTKLAKTNFVWNLSKIYAYAPKFIQIEIIKLLKILMKLRDPIMQEEIINSDLLAKIVITFRENLEKKGLLFSLIINLMEEMTFYRLFRISTYFCNLLLCNNSIDCAAIQYCDRLLEFAQGHRSFTTGIQSFGQKGSKTRSKTIKRKDYRHCIEDICTIFSSNRSRLKVPLCNPRKRKKSSSAIKKPNGFSERRGEMITFFDILEMQGLIEHPEEADNKNPASIRKKRKFRKRRNKRKGSKSASKSRSKQKKNICNKKNKILKKDKPNGQIKSNSKAAEKAKDSFIQGTEGGSLTLVQMMCTYFIYIMMCILTLMIFHYIQTKPKRNEPLASEISTDPDLERSAFEDDEEEEARQNQPVSTSSSSIESLSLQKPASTSLNHQNPHISEPPQPSSSVAHLSSGNENPKDKILEEIPKKSGSE
ncbi:unnamed protein product [Moneuplotes crassus]|uniref:Serine/threonine-protein phosphatase 4 regulatory subunit 3-like central domain-containing protein n=1 Tax=Euplotes crassus TaxID=5936 RepID=A0AAD2CYD6_EUPCR|nr:unnamed protein product [Moneuplotes crassus]